MPQRKISKLEIVLWSLLFSCGLLVVAFFLDESPSEPYQRLAKAPRVTLQSWQNARELMQQGLLPGKSPEIVDKFITLIRQDNISEARALFKSAFWQADRLPTDKLPCNINQKPAAYRQCVVDYLSDKGAVASFSQHYQSLFKRPFQISIVNEAYFDESIIYEGSYLYANDAEMLIQDAMAASLMRWRWNNYAVLSEMLARPNVTEICQDTLVPYVTSKIHLLGNTNALALSVSELVEVSELLELINLTLIKYPELAECLVNFPKPDLVSADSFNRSLLVQARLALRAIEESKARPTLDSPLNFLPRHWLFKPQKTSNQLAEFYDAAIKRNQFLFRHPFAREENAFDSNRLRWRNWNNPIGQLLSELAFPRYVNMAQEYSMLAIKLQLTRAHARLRLCQQTDDENCAQQLQDYADPFYNKPAEFLDGETAIGYRFNIGSTQQTVSVPIKLL